MGITKWLKRSHSSVHYFALGDSISTDDYPGEHRGAASLFYQKLRKIYSHIHFHCHALDGATSYDLLHHQLPRLHTVRGFSIFTITAGGNDILAMQSTPDEIINRIHVAVDHLLQKFRDCIVILGTIYDPSDGEGDLFGEEQPLEKELRYVLEINERIRKMASERVGIADIYSAFLGHGSHCKDPQNRYYHPEDSSLWYILDIEPNVRGAQEVCRLFLSTFEAVNAQ